VFFLTFRWPDTHFESSGRVPQKTNPRTMEIIPKPERENTRFILQNPLFLMGKFVNLECIHTHIFYQQIGHLSFGRTHASVFFSPRLHAFAKTSFASLINETPGMIPEECKVLRQSAHIPVVVVASNHLCPRCNG
jgi:hypothetical protein